MAGRAAQPTSKRQCRADCSDQTILARKRLRLWLPQHHQRHARGRLCLQREAQIASARGYKRHPGLKGGLLSAVASNTLNREFEVDAPNKVWVTDFTYIRTHEGWLYLTVVLDLFSRQVIGWSMKSNPRSDLVIDARMMALWRRKPKEKVLVHSESCSC